MISCCLAIYSLAVLKHGLSTERQEAVSFLKDTRRLSVARFSSGIHQKDICVSFGGLVPGTQTAQTFCPSAAGRAKPGPLPSQGNRSTPGEQSEPCPLLSRGPAAQGGASGHQRLPGWASAHRMRLGGRHRQLQGQTKEQCVAGSGMSLRA